MLAVVPDTYPASSPKLWAPSQHITVRDLDKTQSKRMIPSLSLQALEFFAGFMLNTFAHIVYHCFSFVRSFFLSFFLSLFLLSKKGIEICEDVVQHCKSSIEEWKAAHGRSSTPHIEIIHGNALNVNKRQGETLVGFDRIYVGASVERHQLHQFTSLLRPGGILVGPGKSRTTTDLL